MVTTTGGLYRYAMNDVVHVAGRRQATPLLRFLYKGNHVQDMQGEMMYDRACHGDAGRIGGGDRWQAAPFPGHRRARPAALRAPYRAHRGAGPGQLRRLLAAFDRALGEANENYTIFRTDQLLNPPRLAVMQKGWLERITADHMARSGRDAQFKPAVLASIPEHPEMVEQSLAWSVDERGERRAAGE